MTAKIPDLQALSPPPQPGETIAWCPLCGEVINRVPQGGWSWDEQYEEQAREHMLMVHELEPEHAFAALLEAVKRPDVEGLA